MERFNYHKQSRPAPQSDAIYKTQRWQRLRLMVLADEPVCRHCESALAVDVDHIDGDNTNMTRSNLQALCKSCHSKKTNRENGGCVR